MASGKRDYAILALLLLLTASVYANSLRIPFVIDDQHIIVRNFFLRQWSLKGILQSHLFAPLGAETQYYRPLTLLTFAINYSFSALEPQGYHIVNLTLHLLVVLFSYLLLSKFTSPWIAGFSAALFAVHPANVQAVSYISSRSDPLYAALTLLSLLSWHAGNDARRAKRVLFRSSSLVCFFFALFAKETAVTGPALILLTDWIWNRDTTWLKKLKRNWGWYVGFGFALVIYLMVRVGLAGYSFNMETSREAWKAGRELGFGARTLLAVELLGQYIVLTLFPLNLSFFRNAPLPQSFFEPGVLLGAVSLGLMMALAWLQRSHQKEISYGIFWFLIAILPVLNLTPLNAPMMEHWLYLPLMGMALAFVGSLHALARRLGEVRGAALGLVFLLLLLSARTVSRNADWHQPIRLFLNDASHFPNEAKNWFLLGYAYMEQGMLGHAIEAYKTGLALDPDPYAWSGLGEALSMAGKNEEAEKSLRNAISIIPENPWLHYVLGIHLLKTGKIDAAIQVLTRAGNLNPPLPVVYHALASAYLREGKKVDAEKAFQRALLILPQDSEIHAAIHLELGKLYRSHGDKNAAREEWRIALRFDPDNREAKALLGTETLTPPVANP